MKDRRRLQRNVVLRSARIAYHNQSLPIDCIVYDLTSNGACLRFEAAVQASELFVLSFDNFRSSRPCRVVWQNTDKLGVCFC
jgi:PilZ domain